jgi:hypothetical protein
LAASRSCRNGSEAIKSITSPKFNFILEKQKQQKRIFLKKKTGQAGRCHWAMMAFRHWHDTLGELSFLF